MDTWTVHLEVDDVSHKGIEDFASVIHRELAHLGPVTRIHRHRLAVDFEVTAHSLGSACAYIERRIGYLASSYSEARAVDLRVLSLIPQG